MGPLILASGALQVWSGLQQAEMIRQQTALNQRIAEDNAKYAEQDAWEAEKYGYTQSARYKAIIDSTISEERSGYAAQNVDVNSGTAAAVQQDTKLAGFMNTLDMQTQARNKALGLKVQAANYRIGGDMQGYQGAINASGAEMSGIYGGLGTFAKAGLLNEKQNMKSKVSNLSGYEGGSSNYSADEEGE